MLVVAGLSFGRAVPSTVAFVTAQPLAAIWSIPPVPTSLILVRPVSSFAISSITAITEALTSGWAVDINTTAATAATVVLLVTAPRGLWGGRAGGGAFVAAAVLEPLLGAEGEVAVEVLGGVLAVDEVAEAAADTALP